MAIGGYQVSRFKWTVFGMMGSFCFFKARCSVIRALWSTSVCSVFLTDLRQDNKQQI